MTEKTTQQHWKPEDYFSGKFDAALAAKNKELTQMTNTPIYTLSIDQTPSTAVRIQRQYDEAYQANFKKAQP